jgi:hypothetical protein
MKAISSLSRFALLLGLTAAGSLSAADKAVTDKAAAVDSRVTVVFDHPEKYRDIKDHDFDSDNERGREHFLPMLKEHIEKEAGRLLAPGQKLTITFTDIDLAGDFEPWRGPQLSDVRIVKSIYPPRMDFSFKLTDENDQVLKEGEEKLVDLAYQMRITRSFSDDVLRYEKDMFSDWLRGELKAKPRKR